MLQGEMIRANNRKRSKEKIYVVGHRNPDTDSICSAIAYANLKNHTAADE